MNWDWDATTLAALDAYLTDKGLYEGAPAPKRIGDGHSNLTYLIRVKGGNAVLRRPPPPPLPKGANDVEREAWVLSSLAGQNLPVPGVHAVASAGEVLDVPFYIMEHVPGHIITDRLPDGFDAQRDGASMVFGMVDALADLHAVDWRACGLADFGRPEGFNARHLKRIEGLMNHRDDPAPAWLSDMASELKRDVPAESGESIVHNDFRLGNLIWSDPKPRLLAILDWELATIGDPLLDLGYMACCYPVAGEEMTPTQELSAAFLEPGFPAREEVFARYAEVTGRNLSRLSWYGAMSAWKLAVLYDYQHRLARDTYYTDATQAPRFIAAAERFLRIL
ncbi:Putative aminoglycoside phosphotransferase [Marinovum algicola]|uniref:Predicted kinase, aminoglycoside phosphotransferase (APT) family n=1 Tax=Marinovum algicola TaxID=42444 RepID=A0A975WBY3_9RHOB|nr:phosphotransferase family protein [Marinovum algicola]SEJ83566.1 Predicted kinase, aminoglycoside phosphotransferase (APT) family [Marinovum algicola]SLN62221.1 Putative aminoglycoside phosphotransferase [Marinovum algicola]